MYYTNEDFERFYIRYKSEGIAAKESMQSFCSRNKVPFNLFFKWYKDTRVRVVPVKVDQYPQETIEDPEIEDETDDILEMEQDVTLSIEINTNTGLRIYQENISPDAVRKLVANLEALW